MNRTKISRIKLKHALIVIIALCSSISLAAKQHQINVIVLDVNNGAPLTGIQVIFKFNYTDKKIEYTDANGKATTSYEGKLKQVSIQTVDTNKAYRPGYSYLWDNELKEPLVSKQITLLKAEDFKLKYAEFRKIDVAYDKLIRENGLDSTIFESPDDCKELKEAEFIGGAISLQKYINENIMYPQEAIENNEQGRIYLSFIIEEDGTITHVFVDRGASNTLDLESTRVVYGMPKWQPAECDGKKVRSKGRLPIIFALE